MEGELKKYFALAIVLLITAFLFYASKPYLNAFFGAMIFYFLFQKMYHHFLKKGLPKGLSASLIIIISLLIVIIPLIILFSQVFSEMRMLVANKDIFITGLEDLDEAFPNLHIMDSINDQIKQLSDRFSKLLLSTLQGFSSIAINLVIMYILLFYLLTNSDKVESTIIDILPFNKKNSCKLICEFNTITYSTIVSSGLIAVIQGILMALILFIFGVKSPILWGFISAILSFLPVVGISIIWIPASVYLFATGKVFGAIGIIVFGLILSNVEYFLRPFIQKKVGKMHPLTTLIGIFIGIPVFGLLGVVIGPLLLSYFVLTAKMFREEYYH